MSNPFIMFSASASHIEFMRKHPGTASDYREGEPPRTATIEPKALSWFDRLLGRKPEPAPPPPPLQAPDDWPQQAASEPDIDINHRNIDLYHWILNGTPQPVAGAGSIFQTQFHASHDATPLDDSNQDFAFFPEQLPQLLALVDAVTPESLRHAFHEWCKAKGEEHEPTLEEAIGMHREFVSFGKYLRAAIARKHGLVWFVNN